MITLIYSVKVISLFFGWVTSSDLRVRVNTQSSFFFGGGGGILSSETRKVCYPFSSQVKELQTGEPAEPKEITVLLTTTFG